MSDRKRLLVFAGFLVLFVVAAVAMGYQDDEPNPWHVEAAFSLFFQGTLLIPLLIVWALVRAVRKRRQ